MTLPRRVLALSAALVLGLAACTEREPILPGERIDVRDELVAEGADIAGDLPAPARSVPFGAGVVANADWTQKGRTASHEMPNLALGSGTTRVWSVPIGTGNTRGHRLTAQPVVVGGRVFTLDSQARVSAFSTAGALLWTADLTPLADRAEDASGGGLAYADGRLYATLGFGELIALDPATGGRLWNQRLRAGATGAPTAAGGRVYVAGRDGTGWAVDGANGRVLWTVTATPDVVGVMGGAAPAVGDGAVVFPFTSGELVAVDPESGNRLWTGYLLRERPGRTYARITDITGDPVIAGGRLIAGTHSGETAALELGTGQTLWSAGEGALSPPVVAGGSVFVVSDQNDLARIDASSGEILWSVRLPYFVDERPRRREAIYAQFGPLLAGGRLIVASTDGFLRFFDPVNGAQVGAIELPSGAAVEPVVAGSTLYILTDDGTLSAFR